MEGKKILIIDDELDFTELIATLLRFHDLNVQSFNDPVLAIKSLEEETYDLVLSDLMMPSLDGFGLISQLRAMAKYKLVPIIVLSAKMLSDGERKFLLQNNVNFLTKPFDPQVLVDQVMQILQ